MQSINTLMLSEHDKQAYLKQIPHLPSIFLNQRQLCDLELLLNGGFNPLEGYLSKIDYESVVYNMRLANDKLWPMPIILDVNESLAKTLQENQDIVLRDPEGVALAVLTISDIWQPNKEVEAKHVFGTLDQTHPGVNYLFNYIQPYYIGGKLVGLELPRHYDFLDLRLTPNELRAFFSKMSWTKVIGFQTRNPMHRAHHEMTLRAAKEFKANLLIHPAIGATKPGDIDYFSRVKCYEKIMGEYPEDTAKLSLLPLAMRMAGPRSAVWHALIRKNYGCTHFIVGREHACPGNDATGKKFYGEYDAQHLVKKYEDELGITIVPFKAMAYVANKAQYLPIDEVEKDDEVLSISGTELRRRLKEDLEIPSWYSYPSVINELKRFYPSLKKQGFTIFFTGLSSSGKSTLANALMVKFRELDNRTITLLDGDIVRKHLSSELGFSKADRNTNILRIGFVASEITKHRGIAICAPIAPYHETRQRVRELVSEHGGFIEVYLSTPLSTCEQRDRKGLYKKAKEGLVTGVTGIDDPYEVPKNPECIIDTSNTSVSEAVHEILLKIESLGYF